MKISKAEKTRQFIIEKTAPLFNMKGYSGTSLLDMTEATGLTKGSIYGNFANKDEVALAAYEYNANLLIRNIDLSLMGKMTSYEKLIAITLFYRKNWKNVFAIGGCPLLNTAVDADDNLPFLRKPVQNSFKRWMTKIEDIIQEGIGSGEFKDDIQPAYYSSLIVLTIQGGILLSKTLNEQNHLFTALDRIVKSIDEEVRI